MLDFVMSVAQYDEFPENVGYSHVRKLSTIIQDAVLDRLETLED